MTADTLHRAAALMREEHGPDHKRHEMWSAMADLLDLCASVTDPDDDPNEDGLRQALAAANAYLEADR